MKPLLLLPKLIAVLSALIGTAVYYSLAKPKNSVGTYLMIISIDILLIASLIYSILEKKIKNSIFFSKVLLLFELRKTEEDSFYVMNPPLLLIIIFSAVISSGLIAFSSSTWLVTYFFGMIPVIYLLQLLEFKQNPFTEKSLKDYLRMPIISILISVNGTSLLLLYEIDYKETEMFSIVIAVLTTFGFILCVFIYKLVFTSRYGVYLTSAATLVFYISLAPTIIQGSKDENEELIKIVIFFGAAIPFTLISTSIYLKLDISSNLKNAIFLTLWTLLCIPSISLASSSYLVKNQTLFCDIISYGLLAFGFYCVVLETLARLQQVINRETKNLTVLCFIVLPLGLSIAFYSKDDLPISLFILFLCLALGCLLLCVLFYFPIHFMQVFVSRLASVEEEEPVLWYEDALVLMFSVLWKLLYMICICFITRKLYFYDYSEHFNDQSVVSQGLAILVSALAHSSLLENIILYAEEKDHIYPSVTKLALVGQVVPSSLIDNFRSTKKKWQVIIFVFFIIIEIVSFACLSISITLFFMIFFNIVTAGLFIVAFEIKLKTWDKGSKTISEFLIFIWTWIYIPCVCGSSVISTTSRLGNIDSTSSLIIFFIIVSFCIELGFLSGEVYEKINSFKYVYMNLILEKKGFSQNYRGLIIEDFMNHNFKNFEIIEKGNSSFEEYVEAHMSVVCRQCRLGIDHEMPGLHYEASHLSLLKTLLLDPGLTEKEESDEIEKYFDLNSAKPAESEQNEEMKTGRVASTKRKTLRITKAKISAYREFFSMEPLDVTVKKSNFVSPLIEIYRKKIDKKLVTRDDFFFVFLDVTHDRAKQVELEFNALFILKMLKGIAKLIYKKEDEESMLKVERRLLSIKLNRPKTEKAVEEFVKIPEETSVASKAAKVFLSINNKVKNALDYLVPYSLLSINDKIKEDKFGSILEFLNELNKEEEDEFTGKSIENMNSSIQMLFFASIFNMYSLTSVALNSDIGWINSNLSLSSGIIPADSNWFVSLVISFSLIFFFFISTIIIFILIKKQKRSVKLINWGKSFMVIIAAGMLVENLIFLLSNLTCTTSNDGTVVMQIGPDIECLGPTHVALLAVSVVVFIFYFFLVQIFYPIFYKLSTRLENYFNIEVHCKVIYATIASCISSELINFQLALCLFLAVTLVLYSYFRIKQGTGNVGKFKDDIKEYVIVVWIYIWAILSYNQVVSNGYIVLLITIFIYSIYSQRGLVFWIFQILRNCFCKKGQEVRPEVDENKELKEAENERTDLRSSAQINLEKNSSPMVTENFVGPWKSARNYNKEVFRNESEDLRAFDSQNNKVLYSEISEKGIDSEKKDENEKVRMFPSINKRGKKKGGKKKKKGKKKIQSKVSGLLIEKEER